MKCETLIAPAMPSRCEQRLSSFLLLPMQIEIQLQQGNGQLVTAHLCTMQMRHLQDFNTIWKAMLEGLNAEDTFWDWTRKKRLSLSQDRYEAYAIEYGDLTQGLLWIETQWHRSQWAIGQPLK